MSTLQARPFSYYVSDAQQSFTGWDFSYLAATGRMCESPLPWNLYTMIEPIIRDAESMLDMGTGGGEFLSRLAPLPPNTYATEGYMPNVLIAAERLKPWDVKVIAYEDEQQLPLPSAHFDLIMNRHESFASQEVYRMLKPNALFITQQCGGHNDIEFNHMLGVSDPEYVHWNMESAAEGLRATGLEIIAQQEYKGITRFFDVGAIIYYLNIIEWQVEDFSVERYEQQLRNIHDRIVTEGYVDVTCHRFLLAARKKES
ncbi:class I SAM-dependent methyltransferase [Paenibacillus sp. UMB4589-SE434]|uniref:class I SAM-dependent methyltransferase n=1 Tax=Paenibacillus sp. UMB4589-SE434 TaxID=3046314 RepID=UPI00254B2C30|nr:class I SAM-dependent methyltransferase [Paenibacillus sp. UMB4589-SE434]MDK8180525.1 class I SAM-dependent methyltransferase [Paenibacillus sp. UMB4589-SE434]